VKREASYGRDLAEAAFGREGGPSHPTHLCTSFYGVTTTQFENSDVLLPALVAVAVMDRPVVPTGNSVLMVA
jgi:hypothetical protein